jgi:electron transport complex protein RnfB
LKENIYEKLRVRLDEMATGYPETESKVEIRLLERLFTEEEAELFLQLSPILENPKDVAKRLNRDPKELVARMEQMAQKGLLFRKRKGDSVRYSAVPYVVGIFEFQLKRMDKGFARDHEEYFETAFGHTIQSFKTPVLRTIPINRQLVANYPVAPFEDVLQIIEDQKKLPSLPVFVVRRRIWLAKGVTNPRRIVLLSAPTPSIMLKMEWDATSPSMRPKQLSKKMKKTVWLCSRLTPVKSAGCAAAAATAVVSSDR